MQSNLRDIIESRYALQIKRLQQVAGGFPIDMREIANDNEENMKLFGVNGILAAQMVFTKDSNEASTIFLGTNVGGLGIRHASYYWYSRPEVGHPVVNVADCEATDGHKLRLVEYEAIVLDRDDSPIGYRLSIDGDAIGEGP